LARDGLLTDIAKIISGCLTDIAEKLGRYLTDIAKVVPDGYC